MNSKSIILLKIAFDGLQEAISKEFSIDREYHTLSEEDILRMSMSAERRPYIIHELEKNLKILRNQKAPEDILIHQEALIDAIKSLDNLL